MLVVLFMAGSAWARPVDINTAQRVGSAFLSSVGHPAASLLTPVESPFNEFFIFNAEGGGFVLVAGDDCVRPIMGYSLSQSFRTSQMPTNLRDWLEDYNGEITRLKKLEQEQTQKPAPIRMQPVVDVVAEEWSRLLSGEPLDRQLETSVAPLVTTTWNQGTYYNDLCPYDSAAGRRSYTGCVATAMAQILKYWNYPATGFGSYSYESDFGTLSADFGATSYAWSDMPTVLDASSSQAEVDAVALLMYHVGVSVNMGYSGTGSGAGTYTDNYGQPGISAQYSYMQYFKYAPDIANIFRSEMTDSAFCAIIRAEHDASRPVQFSGRDTDAGHSFVLDGYDVYNNFHINWGWGGYCDGYYTIGAFNPAPGGIGGNTNGTYNIRNAAVVNIHPNTDFGSECSVTLSTVGGNASCTAGGGGNYLFGDTVEVYATAGEGYRFAEWSNHSQYNPYYLIVNGGNTNLTARFEPIGSDTMSYCGVKRYLTSVGSTSESPNQYWGIRLPASSLTVGRTLTAMDFFAIKNGYYDFTIYTGTDSPTDTVYSTTKYINSSENGSWVPVYLPQPYTVESGKSIWLTVHSTASYPVAVAVRSGNPDGFLWGSDFEPYDYYAAMIRGRFVAAGVVASGDTISYCNNMPTISSFGGIDEWGIMIPAADLQGRNYLKSVMLNVNHQGTYNLRVYKGGANAPRTLVHFQPSSITQTGWNEIVVDNTVAIAPTDSLWITFSCDDVAWFGTSCRYAGSRNSTWFLSEGEWTSISDYGYDNSWQIKAVTSATAPELPQPTLIIRGCKYVKMGESATFTALHSVGTTVSWDLGDGTPATATGDTVQVSWNQTGPQVISASIIRNLDTVTALFPVNVESCDNPITDFPYNLGFETSDNKVCLETFDADGDGYCWLVDDYAIHAHSGIRCFASDAVVKVGEDYDTLTPDNWFFLPAMVTRAVGGYSLQWSANIESGTPTYGHYAVYIDTTASSDTANYELLQDFEMEAGGWQQLSINLSEYAGKLFRLAFRHFNNGEGVSRIYIDDISVIENIPFFREGDTLSYCGYRSWSGSIGYGEHPTFWAICITPERLVGSDTVKSVLLYVNRPGEYSLNILQGDHITSATAIYSADTTFSDEYSWQSFDLETPVAIDTTLPLWVGLSTESLYPAANTYFSGDTNSDWLSGDGIHWVHSSQYDYYLSWLIKVVTAAYNPCGGDPSRFLGDTTAVVCDSYTWYGETYTESAEPTHTLANAEGCDSIITLHLTVNHGRRTHEYVTNCGPYTWPVNGRTYNQSGVKFNRDTTAEGCLIRDTLDLTVNPISTSDTAATASGSFTWYGTTYTESGDVTHTLTNQYGCDSVVTLHLTVYGVGIETSEAFATPTIYPNPTTGHLQIAAERVDRVEVLDLVGRCVAVFENSTTINLSNLADGTYTLRISLPEGVTLRKVVKR